MTPTEFRNEMARLQLEIDSGVKSSEADMLSLIIKVMRDMGYGAGISIYERKGDRWLGV